ncbi:MAG: hypothetical protein Satyrvirus33_4 [Satyrvirus sp.]|uniref:Uncharacterized protein n=1 Tax=Satyrvirus sp. TaxID=2487771 RepID=A0A3G5AGI8_9VIRU|nr:MAG: hypothetical protein Satyrvirus33_4 [Satyrvirus sp.]
MKTAIFFCGSIRDFPTCLPSIKRYLLKNFGADIFLHLWKMDDISSLDTDIDFKWRNDSCDEQYVIDQLKPVSYVVDKYSSEWEEKIIRESGIDITKLTDDKLKNYGTNACGMYYKICQAFKLVEDYSLKNGITYDLVIRARLDFIWDSGITISDFGGINGSKVYLVKDRYATCSGLVTNDKFFAGNFSVMKNMCNLFNYILRYQSYGLKVEGQTLHENHIKYLKLNAVWIGDAYTFYKCMPRHRITWNKKSIVINNLDNKFDKFFYELSYYLLYNNYSVTYSGCSCSYLDILKTFRNFKIENNFSPNNTNSTLCLVSNSYHENVNNMNQIVVNYSTNFPTNKIANKTSFINISDNISLEDLLDFVVSIITTYSYGNTYNFTSSRVIDKVDVGENVLYRYLDHGYYLSKIVSFDEKNSKYTVEFGKYKEITGRKYFKIVNLLKYHEKMDPLVMPTNCR